MTTAQLTNQPINWLNNQPTNRLANQPTSRPPSACCRCLGSSTFNCEPGVQATLITPGDLNDIVTACAEGVASPMKYFVSDTLTHACACFCRVLVIGGGSRWDLRRQAPCFQWSCHLCHFSHAFPSAWWARRLARHSDKRMPVAVLPALFLLLLNASGGWPAILHPEHQRGRHLQHHLQRHIWDVHKDCCAHSGRDTGSVSTG